MFFKIFLLSSVVTTCQKCFATDPIHPFVRNRAFCYIVILNLCLIYPITFTCVLERNFIQLRQIIISVSYWLTYCGGGDSTNKANHWLHMCCFIAHSQNTPKKLLYSVHMRDVSSDTSALMTG